MKATIDIPDDIYRQVKAKSALEGKAVREVAIDLFSQWLEEIEPSRSNQKKETSQVEEKTEPIWFGSLKRFAGNAQGKFDMDSIRASVAVARSRKEGRP